MVVPFELDESDIVEVQPDNLAQRRVGPIAVLGRQPVSAGVGLEFAVVVVDQADPVDLVASSVDALPPAPAFVGQLDFVLPAAVGPCLPSSEVAAGEAASG